jgi:hypothetical protein
MTDASRWRMDLAPALAKVYMRQPAPVMIALGGSAVRGEADAYSDMDMLVYWKTIDSTLQTAAPLQILGARRFNWVEQGVTGCLEQYFLGNLKIDVGHIPLEWLDGIICDVTNKGDTTPDKLGTLGGFLEALPLYGEETYRQYCGRIKVFPDALARKLVEQHLFFYPRWVLERHALGRNDLFHFYETQCAMLRNLVGVLAGLNRVYV